MKKNNYILNKFYYMPGIILTHTLTHNSIIIPIF